MFDKVYSWSINSVRNLVNFGELLTLNMHTISPSPRYEICPLVYIPISHPDHPKTCHRYFFECFSRRLGISVTNGVILCTTQSMSLSSLVSLLAQKLNNKVFCILTCTITQNKVQIFVTCKKKQAHLNKSAVNLWGRQSFTFLSGELEIMTARVSS